MESNYITELYTGLTELPLTVDLIKVLPKLDLHVHLPGTISPLTAWTLGIRNRLISLENGTWVDGPVKLPDVDPHTHYSHIFENSADITLNSHNIPESLSYNIAPNNFKSFDRIMATVQGHRHPPGGIQTEDDLRLVLRAYLADCIAQNIFYTEVQQNIRIAYHLYPDNTAQQARFKLYALLQESVEEFKNSGVHLRFLHCFNKTQMSGVNQSSRERALESAEWLHESKEVAPGLFVGLEAAGHEKDQHGWPVHLKDGYELAASLGFGCEAHGGEGIGVEHMMDVARTLPVTRIAHGFQVIECEDAIAELQERGITLVMSPIINLSLGACVHRNPETGQPLSAGKGGKQVYFNKLSDHPFFTLLRQYKLPITLCSDNPQMAGIPIQDLMMILGGIKAGSCERLPVEWQRCLEPLTTLELVKCLVNGIQVAFCEESLKQAYLNKLHAVLEDFKAQAVAA